MAQLEYPFGAGQVRAGILKGLKAQFEPTEIDNEFIATGDGIQTVFTHTTANQPILPKTVGVTTTINNAVVEVFDDGQGNFLSPGVLQGTVDYATGAINLEYIGDPPDNNMNVVVDYKYGDWGNLIYSRNGVSGTGPNKIQLGIPYLATGQIMQVVLDIEKVTLGGSRGEAF